MYKTGDIVYHKKLKFCDNMIDKKKYRPCVVLFSIYKDNQEYVCTCPFTSQTKSFNKHPDKYMLLPFAISSYRKLSFAKIDNISLYKVEDTYSFNLSIDQQTVKMLLKKIKRYILYRSEYSEIQKYIEYSELFDTLEKKKIK